MLRETRYIMFGPGVSTIPNAVNAMPNAAAIEIVTSATMSDAWIPAP
jgi:hypothetical protein